MYFTHTTRRDARKVVASLRQMDSDEARVLHGVSRPNDIVDLIMVHPSFTIRSGSASLGLFGAVSFGSNWAAPWLIGTEALTASSHEFIRASRPVFHDLIRPFDYITNAMLRSNVVHRRWLRWMGVTEGWEYDVHNGVEIVRFTACVSQLLPPHPSC